ncbi:FAD-dependent oxidoreductase [Prosthecochloris sp.]|uniref:FAD-dependent oxidoreductase n=1 Tax=Prosthecochloris sp. TaxID=290513 RepID=UPI0025D0213B|nr:FAD-dependent oxidoreductase [Prosthecochloris sp.]
MNTVTFTLNGKEVSAKAGVSILEAARQNGTTIPTLCHHESLHALGSCWMCIVEIKGKHRFVPACSTDITPGIAIETDTPELYAIRKKNLERLLEHHCGDCSGPCEISCPAGCDIPAFVSAIAKGNDSEAIAIIKNDIPLPGILGRVCHAPCEDECRRHGIDEPLSICSLKRFAADKDIESGNRHLPSCKPKTGKKVAIIGSGPAGLTAAYYLLRDGHDVIVYDSHEAPGGMMRYGIPPFRLPVAIIEADLEPIRSMGADFICNTVFGTDITLDSLKQDGVDALFLAVGAQRAGSLGIEGEETEGVLSGIDFLNSFASGSTVTPGNRVLVIGGGNTAIDAARTALRLGAKSVRILYRRTMEEMPANRTEIEEALHEGISIDVLTAPTGIKKVANGLLLTTVKMTLGEPDGTGRRRPVPLENSESTFSADLVITAIGQNVDKSVHETQGITSAMNGTVLVEPATLRTSIPWVFAGGDCVTGADTAVNAVRQGKLAAKTIDAFLDKKTLGTPPMTFHSSYGARDRAPEGFYRRATPSPRAKAVELPMHLRISGFDEVSTGFSEEQAREEAQRCLRCSCISKNDCRLRMLASTYDISQECGEEEHEDFSVDRGADVRFEREKCVDCGICVRTLEETDAEKTTTMQLLVERCPTGALS